MRPLIALLSTALLLTACGDDGPSADTAGAGTVGVANCGRTTRVEQPPRRALGLTQPATEIMLSLGLADRMAGTSGWADRPLPSLRAANAKVPRLAKDFPSFERALEAEPDFAYSTFAYAFSSEAVAPRERFERLGVPTYVSRSECGGQEARQRRALTLDDVLTEIREIARLFGVPERGERLAARLRARAEDAAGGLRAGDVSLLWWYSSTKTPYMAGCCGAPGIITRAVGARNAFGERRQLWPEIGWEAVLARDPDVLVLADLTRGDEADSAREKIRFLESDPVARRLTAVRERRYVVLSGSEMDPSIRNVDGIEKLAAGLRRLGVAR